MKKVATQRPMALHASMPACPQGLTKSGLRGGDIQNKETVYPPQRGGFMETLTAALRYIARGVAVIPVHRDAQKNPYLSSYSQYYWLLPTWQDWRKWANRWPLCNIGLITGYWGLCAFDFDTQEAYQAWCEGPGRGIRGQTWTTRTARGYHVWFEVQGDPGESRSYTYQGHEVLLRAKGGYCIVPPSVHHSGARYYTVHRVEPWQTDSIDYYLEGWAPKKQQPKLSNLGRSGFAASDHSQALGVTSQNHKTEYRIEDFISIPEGARPNGRGAYKVYCPFHEDSSPSAWVNVQEQRFGCNACWPGKWLDVVNIISLKEGISNKEAFLKVKQPIN